MFACSRSRAIRDGRKQQIKRVISRIRTDRSSVNLGAGITSPTTAGAQWLRTHTKKKGAVASALKLSSVIGCFRGNRLHVCSAASAVVTVNLTCVGHRQPVVVVFPHRLGSVLCSVFLQARRRRLLVGHLLRGRVPTLAGLPGVVHPRLIRRVSGVDVGGGVVLRRSEFPFASPAYSSQLTTTHGLSVLFVFPERRHSIRICLLPSARVSMRRSSTESTSSVELCE